MTPSLATTVAGIPLDCCIYNASGPRSGTSAALAKVAGSASGAVLAKSVTLVSQTGNPMPRCDEPPHKLSLHLLYRIHTRQVGYRTAASPTEAASVRVGPPRALPPSAAARSATSSTRGSQPHTRAMRVLRPHTGRPRVAPHHRRFTTKK